MLDLKQLTAEVCRIATETGHFLKEERKGFRRERVIEKHAHDYVSYVDKESEVRIVKALTALLPEAGFITEEGSATYQDEPYCWVIDPLDGTTNYIHDEAPYCVCIALRNRTELLLGVVYEVCRDECFYAWKAENALCLDGDFHGAGSFSFGAASAAPVCWVWMNLSLVPPRRKRLATVSSTRTGFRMYHFSRMLPAR